MNIYNIMKKLPLASLFLFFICLFTTNILFSQKNKTIYYDADWKVIPSKKGASFYRILAASTTNIEITIAKDYYINGQIQMEAELKSIEPEVIHGMIKYYYVNGQVKISGTMTDGKRTGNWTYYYANGIKKMEGIYENDLREGNWKVSNLEGKEYLIQTYKLNKIIAINLLDDSKGLYEYETEIDSTNKINIKPMFTYRSAEEFKVMEPYILKNIQYLQTCTDFVTFDITFQYTLLWLTNCPYLGRFEIVLNKFSIDHTTSIDKSYNYRPYITKVYYLGLGKYFIESNGGKLSDPKCNESAAIAITAFYTTMKNKDAKNVNDRLENLLNAKNNNTLLEYINNYK